MNYLLTDALSSTQPWNVVSGGLQKRLQVFEKKVKTKINNFKQELKEKINKWKEEIF